MPREIKEKDKFSTLLEKATLVRVVKMGDQAKVKARTKDLLYTFKTTSEEADALTKGLKVKIEEYYSPEENKQ